MEDREYITLGELASNKIKSLYKRLNLFGRLNDYKVYRFFKYIIFPDKLVSDDFDLIILWRYIVHAVVPIIYIAIGITYLSNDGSLSPNDWAAAKHIWYIGYSLYYIPAWVMILLNYKVPVLTDKEMKLKKILGTSFRLK